jgi:hypothetical protein
VKKFTRIFLILKAYQHGRSWLAANIRSLANPKDTARADQLEEQAKLVFSYFFA